MPSIRDWRGRNERTGYCIHIMSGTANDRALKGFAPTCTAWFHPVDPLTPFRALPRQPGWG
jgi:hypothetical protein